MALSRVRFRRQQMTRRGRSPTTLRGRGNTCGRSSRAWSPGSPSPGGETRSRPPGPVRGPAARAARHPHRVLGYLDLDASSAVLDAMTVPPAIPDRHVTASERGLGRPLAAGRRRRFTRGLRGLGDLLAEFGYSLPDQRPPPTGPLEADVELLERRRVPAVESRTVPALMPTLYGPPRTRAPGRPDPPSHAPHAHAASLKENQLPQESMREGSSRRPTPRGFRPIFHSAARHALAFARCSGRAGAELQAVESGVPATAICHSAFEGSRLPELASACWAWNHVMRRDGVTPATLRA